MAITFAYTESTNVVVQTEGTAGTPATFANFVTADRAGTGTSLLDAGTPANDLALTYAVRPVEDLAIKVKCVVANKTAEEDYIFITGTDWRGAAQTESIDVSAGNGSYETTEYWASITTLDCSDNAAGGGNVWDDGDLSVTQDVWGVIWDYGNSQYYITANFDIGNGSTTTYFKTTNETIVFAAGVYCNVNAEATFDAGNKVSSWGEDGSYLSFSDDNHMYFGDNSSANVNLYATTIYWRSTNKAIIFNGTMEALNCSFLGTGDSSNALSHYDSGVYTIQECYYSDWGYTQFLKSPSTFNNCHLHSIAQNRLYNDPMTIPNLNISNTTYVVYKNSGSNDVTLKNPKFTISQAQLAILGGTGKIIEQYTCDIHVADSDGSNLSGATVDCEDKNGTAAWAAGSVTTAVDGTITQQTINYRDWATTDETETTYSPHKFTISKAGYKTLVFEAVTVDGTIDWHLELKDININEMQEETFLIDTARTYLDD